MDENKRKKIVKDCDIALKLLSELEIKIDSFILKRRNDALEIRRKALMDLLGDEKEG